MKTLNRKKQHIELLSKLGGLPISASRYGALKLNEKALHRLNEQYCNGDINAEYYDKWRDNIKKSVIKKLPNLKDYLVFNGDPRGYALKIDDDFVRKYFVP
jgi:hypothetical protein